jgi:microcin C transport system substrate-binding protein
MPCSTGLIKQRFALWILLVLGVDSPLCRAQEKLPPQLQWETNETDPILGSKEAVKGGTFRIYTRQFPLTLRPIGPNTSTPVDRHQAGIHYPLIGHHAITGRIIPLLAKSWAISKDQRTMYLRLNPKAKWSDGKPFSAQDVAFTLETMRRKEIVDPPRTRQFENSFERVIVYDSHTLAIVLKNPTYAISNTIESQFWPILPKHVLEGKIDKDFPRIFNWTIIPGTGAYQFDKIEKGRRLTFRRLSNWWGEGERYFQNRFNVAAVELVHYRDEDVAFEAFKKGDIDTFWMTRPVSWHEKTKDPVFTKGYIERLWQYHGEPRGPTGYFLNVEHPLFADPHVRYALAHALNFDLVIKTLLYGDYRRKEQLYNYPQIFQEGVVKGRVYDLNEVARLMQASGWQRNSEGLWQKDKQIFRVRLLLSNAPQLVQRATLLQSEARKAGLDLTLDIRDDTTESDMVNKRQYMMASLNIATSINPDPCLLLQSQQAVPYSQNFSMVKDPELDRLCEQFNRQATKAEAAKVMVEIEKRVHTLGFYLGSWFPDFDRQAFWRWVRFPEGFKLGVTQQQWIELATHYETGGYVWLDEARRAETLKARQDGRSFSPVVILNKKPADVGL